MASTLAFPSRDRVPNQGYSISHRGIDYGWGDGDEVYAAEAGTINYERNVAGYGNRLTIDHGALIKKGTKTRYAHLRTAVVTSGKVKRGQLIGYMGNTGSYAQFKHLHFELLITVGVGYVKSNPSSYFTDSAGAPKPPVPILKEDTMYIAVNANNSNEDARRLLVTSVSAPIITEAQSRIYVKLGVPFATVNREEWLVLYNDGLARERRLQTPAAPITEATVDAIATGVKNKLDIPTAAQNGLAARAAIVK